MSRDEMTAPRRTRLSGSGRVRALLSLGIVLGLGSVGTLAAWSDSATAKTGIFSTGSVDLKLNGDDGKPTAYAFTALSMGSMAPGRSIAATLPVENAGSIAFKYSATAKAVAESGTGNAATFADNLTLTVRAGGSVSGTAPNQTCTGGEQIASRNLTMTADSLIETRPTTPLAAGANEKLCFEVKLGPTPPDAAQSANLHTEFVFTATAVIQP